MSFSQSAALSFVFSQRLGATIGYNAHGGVVIVAAGKHSLESMQDGVVDHVVVRVVYEEAR